VRTKVRKRDRIHLSDEAEQYLSNNFSFSFERQAVQGGYVSGEARVQRYVSKTEYIYPAKQSNIYQTILVFRLRDKLCKEDMYLAKRAYKGTQARQNTSIRRSRATSIKRKKEEEMKNNSHLLTKIPLKKSLLGSAHSLLELVNASAGINKLLLTCVKRVTL